ncbi:MAG: 2-hydroxyacid dehydrogenase [Pseudohongiellaceae bacterium]
MTKKHELIIANPFHPETIELLDNLYSTHHLWRLEDPEKAKLIRELEGQCSAVATASWQCDPAVYALKSLELIACFGVGVDGIDFEQASRLGAKVSNTPEVLDAAVADIALALILNTTRNIINADAYVRNNDWKKKGPFPFGQGLQGKTLGIAGLGRIGKAIALRALPFGLKIAYHNRRPVAEPYQYCNSIEELAKESDILLCMLPGGAATKHLINSAVFQLLGEEGFFINVGRGSCVDELALATALENHVICGAGLDVYEREPSVPEALRKQERLVLLPHIGSATVETRRAMGQLVADNLHSYFNDHSLVSEYDYL